MQATGPRDFLSVVRHRHAVLSAAGALLRPPVCMFLPRPLVAMRAACSGRGRFRELQSVWFVKITNT